MENSTQKPVTTLSIPIDRILKTEVEEEISRIGTTKKDFFYKLLTNRNNINSIISENENLKANFSNIAQETENIKSSLQEKEENINSLKDDLLKKEKEIRVKDKEIKRLEKWKISDEFGAVVVFVINSVEGVTNMDEALSYILRPFQNKGALIPSEQDIERYKERFEND